MTSSNNENLDMAFLSAVVSADKTCWTEDIKVNGELMKFKVDTGAEVTAVTKLALKQLGNVAYRVVDHVNIYNSNNAHHTI